MIKKINDTLRGYRTYIIGWLMVVTAVAHWAVGDMTSFELFAQLPDLLQGLGFITVRAAVANYPKTVDAVFRQDKKR